MSAQADDANRLQDIAGAFYAERMTRDEARSAVIDVVLRRMHCSRVSLWKFERERGHLSLLCFASKIAGGTLLTVERRLRDSEYRDYFNGLIERGVYLSDDAMRDAALQPMRESYLVANHIVSMLDAAFVVNNRAFGMVCCEETGEQRHWTASDIASLRAIVNKLALLMATADDHALWGSPSLPLRELRSALPAPPL